VAPIRSRLGIAIILIGALLALASASTPHDPEAGHVTPVVSER
jgi:hypothetical protein